MYHEMTFEKKMMCGFGIVISISVIGTLFGYSVLQETAQGVQQAVDEQAVPPADLAARARAQALSMLLMGIMGTALSVVMAMLIGRSLARTLNASAAGLLIYNADLVFHNQAVREKVEELSTLITSARAEQEPTRDRHR